MEEMELVVQKSELLNIFKNDEDKYGNDLLNMSDFSDLFILDRKDKLNKYNKVDTYISEIDDSKGILSGIVGAIKTGFDIKNMTVYVADTSGFSQEIIDKLKSGEYYMGESAQVPGQNRPVVLDKDGHIVKWYTLKRAINPQELFNDLSNLSTQKMLKSISDDIKSVSKQLDYAIDLERRELLSNRFINARENIKKAYNNPEEMKYYLREAEKYLTEGITSLYSDLEAEISKLKDQSIFFGKMKDLDFILGHITDDFLMIPKYIAVQVYLFYLLNRFEDAKDVINNYKFTIERLSKTEVKKGYTPFMLIHDAYKYPQNSDSINYWIELPTKTAETLNSLDLFISSNGKNVVYIEEISEE